MTVRVLFQSERFDGAAPQSDCWSGARRVPRIPAAIPSRRPTRIPSPFDGWRRYASRATDRDTALNNTRDPPTKSTPSPFFSSLMSTLPSTLISTVGVLHDGRRFETPFGWREWPFAPGLIGQSASVHRCLILQHGFDSVLWCWDLGLESFFDW